MTASLLMTAALAAAIPGFGAPEVRFFPGSYFDTVARYPIQARALRSWPGPAGLSRLWFDEELDESSRVVLLLGAAAFHDPQMLPVYRDAVERPSQRLRQAAAWGYRDLIGDRLPDLRRPIDDRTARMLAGEMQAVEATLRRQPLPAFWLQALLAVEERSLPGYAGVVLQRGRGDALRALDRLVEPADLTLLVRAYEASGRDETRIGIVRLVEGLALEKFVEKPTGPRAGWGTKTYRRAMEAFEEWVDRRAGPGCRIDEAEVVRSQMAALGLPWVGDPFGAEACGAWQQVLLHGLDTWWSTAAEQLYRCGAPPARVSNLQVEDDPARRAREQVLEFYGLRPTASRGGARP